MAEIPIPHLGDELVVLRRLRDDDAPSWVAAYEADAELNRTTGFENAWTEDAVLEHAARLERARVQGEAIELAVADPQTDAFLGSVMLHSFHWRHRRAELGAWMIPEARRQGLVRRATELVLDWAFGELGLERIELQALPDNAPAIAFAETMGFPLEGRLRKRNVEHGQRVDMLIWGVLRDEWQARRAR